MTTQDPNENLGRLDDDAEAEEQSSTTDGPAAEGEYDPAQGSPGHQAHPVRRPTAAPPPHTAGEQG